MWQDLYYNPPSTTCRCCTSAYNMGRLYQKYLKYKYIVSCNPEGAALGIASRIPNKAVVLLLRYDHTHVCIYIQLISQVTVGHMNSLV